MGRYISIGRKTKTLLKDGLAPFLEGKENFKNNLLCVEVLAKERLAACITCPFFKDEPIDFLKVIDDRILELSGKYCEDCGCELPYKIRQSIKKCEKWQK